MKTNFILAAVAVLAASASYAGNYDPVLIEPVVVFETATDWTGFYVGASAGRTNSLVWENSVGVQTGYRYEFYNSVVLGTELGYVWNQGVVADKTEVSGILGYGADSWLPYVHAGYAWTDSVTDGITYGAGVDYKLTDQHSIGVKYTRSDFVPNDTNVSVRYSFNF